MSKQTRLNTEQAIALLEHSDEDDWANSDDEDADDTYEPDPLEIAEWEASEGEESLLNDSASDRQHTDACSPVTGTETSTNAQSDNHDQQINDGNTQINTDDTSQSINGDTNVLRETSHSWTNCSNCTIQSSSIYRSSWTTTYPSRECQCS